MKKANAIIVGGTTAVGKSSLVGGLPFNSIQELDPNDELQHILLEKMYSGDPIASQIFQLDMILTRMDKYRENSKNQDETYIYDRFIFEDFLFAKPLLSENKNAWNYYKNIWNDLVDELINEIGKPQLYIILTCSWEEFKERLHTRKRPPEIERFKSDPDHFKTSFDSYVPNTKALLEKYEIDYLVFDTSGLTQLEVLDQVGKILKEKGIK